tara:strand:- start:1467 stop:2033 length:567 start_codon:yes stop_codon:yes gene_type:complete
MPVNPNPQGKGLVPILQGLDRHRLDRLLPPKKIDQVQMELFTSMFVLKSEIRFSPLPNQRYYLYQTDGRYKLLLVGPQQWCTPYRGRYIGECILHDDRTWSMALDPAMAHDTKFMAHIEQEQEKLQSALESAETVEDVLPVFEGALGYNSRILAYILGKSLGISMELSGIKSLNYHDAKGLLQHDKTA